MAALAVTASILGGGALAACGSANTVGMLRSSANDSVVGRAQSDTHWPARTVLAERPELNIVSQVLDPHTRTDFALTVAGHGTYRLRRTSVPSGQVRVGRPFPVNSIALASGWLWVFGGKPLGTSERPKLYQVDERSLAVVRTWTLAAPRVRFAGVAITAGLHGTIWIAFSRTVRHINVRSGATVGGIRLPTGLLAGDLALSPSGHFLYVATSDQIGSRDPVIEYSVSSGQRLAINTRSVHAAALGGGTLTAAPGGVWVSFRTGMAGGKLLLRQPDLGLVKLPGAGSPRSLFKSEMWAVTEYADTSVFLVKFDGTIACLNPRTGHVRARGTVSGGREISQLLGFRRPNGPLYAVTAHGVIAVRQPAACRVR